jgi:hypothetical protein
MVSQLDSQPGSTTSPDVTAYFLSKHSTQKGRRLAFQIAGKGAPISSQRCRRYARRPDPVPVRCRQRTAPGRVTAQAVGSRPRSSRQASCSPTSSRRCSKSDSSIRPQSGRAAPNDGRQGARGGRACARIAGRSVAQRRGAIVGPRVHTERRRRKAGFPRAEPAVGNASEQCDWSGPIDQRFSRGWPAGTRPGKPELGAIADWRSPSSRLATD